MADELVVTTEARDRDAVFKEFGVPARTAYRTMEVWSPAPGDVRARYGTIAAGGATTVDDERPVVEVPGQSWPRPYRVAVYGVDEAVYLPALATLIALGAAPQPAPLEVLEIHPRGQRVLLVVLRATVRYGDAPVYLDAHRHRDGTWTEVLAGLEYPHTQLDIELAWKGLPQLREVRRGKQVGDGIESAALFLARCEDTAAALWAHDILVEDLDVFLGQLGKPSGRTAFYRRLARYWDESHERHPWAEGWGELRAHLQRHVLADAGRTNRNGRRRLAE